MSSRWHCLTDFHYPEQYSDDKFWKFTDRMQFVCWQIEKCPTTGNEHLQMLIYYPGKQRFTYTHKWYEYVTGHKCSVTAQSGRREVCGNYYANKEDTRVAGKGPYKWGTEPSPGKRTDLIEFVKTIQTESDMKKIVEQHPAEALKFCSAVHKLHKLYHGEPDIRPAPQIFWIWGPTGVGKSTLFNKYHHVFKPYYYYQNGCSEFWEQYSGQETVRFEEFDDTKFPLIKMLTIFGVEPYLCPQKGASYPLKAFRFWFTTNKDPTTMYRNEFNHSAWLRRLSTAHVEHTTCFADTEAIIKKWESLGAFQ